MKRRRSESELRLSGLGLRARFALAMTISLGIVMTVTAFIIYAGATRITNNALTDTLAESVRVTRDTPPLELVEGKFKHRSGTEVQRYRGRDGTGRYFHVGSEDDVLGKGELYVPDRDGGQGKLLRLLAAIMALVVVVGALVALWVAGQVARPVHTLIEDVRQIAKGDLKHRTDAVGAGEIELLARSIDRMTRDLEGARKAELELSIRKREREVAAGVREALLPLATPLCEGYDVGAAFLGGPDFGGDFHDFIERADGRLGLLVCGVAGNGIPAALVGATARSYLRAELERSDDLVESMRRVNRWLFDDVRRGMYVTALYALVDPQVGAAQIVCAGHRVPLLRFDAETDQMRVVHPEGIALGFDKGPVFDRRIQMVETPIEPGDRFVLTNSAPVEIQNAAGEELGDKPFYARVMKHAQLGTTDFMKALRRDLERYGGDDGIRRDISLVTISREA